MTIKQRIKELQISIDFQEINQFLHELNRLLTDFSDVDLEPHRSDLINNLKEAVSHKINLDQSQDKTIFQKSLNLNDRSLVGAVMIQVLNTSTFLFDDRNFAKRTIELMERLYSDTKWLKLPAGYLQLEQFEKILFLQETIRNNFERIRSDLRSIYDISDTNKMKNEILKTLNSSFYKNAVKVFLVSTVTDKRSINKIFAALDQYSKSNLKEKHKLYELAEQRLKNYIGKFCYDDYPNRLLSSSFENMLSILREDYKKSPYSRPTIVSILQIKKKFLLNEENKTHKIPITIVKDDECLAKSLFIEITSNDDNVRLSKSRFEFSNFHHRFLDVHIELTQLTPVEFVQLKAEILWENVDSSPGERTVELKIYPQRTDINWDLLKKRNPYDTEPVIDEESLIGREDIIKKIYPQISEDRISSFFLYGQKRVGKTSIAKTLLNKLKKDNKNSINIYKETGDYHSSDPQETINELGSIICRAIISSNNKFRGLSIPDFKGSLNKISGFIDDVHMIDPDKKIIIVLDEFDEISPDLYLKGSIGDAFFLTLRALSNKEFLSFILVGGEKMRIILDSQGEQINKFVATKGDGAVVAFVVVVAG